MPAYTINCYRIAVLRHFIVSYMQNVFICFTVLLVIREVYYEEFCFELTQHPILHDTIP